MRLVVFTATAGLALVLSGPALAGAPFTPQAPTAVAKPATKKPASPLVVPKFHGLRIPPGGAAGGAAPGGAGKIVMYRYGRTAATVEGQLRALLKADKWVLAGDKKSPRGSVRLEVKRQGHTVKISITGSGKQAALILTRQ